MTCIMPGYNYILYNVEKDNKQQKQHQQQKQKQYIYI